MQRMVPSLDRKEETRMNITKVTAGVETEKGKDGIEIEENINTEAYPETNVEIEIEIDI